MNKFGLQMCFVVLHGKRKKIYLTYCIRHVELPVRTRFRGIDVRNCSTQTAMEFLDSIKSLVSNNAAIRQP